MKGKATTEYLNRLQKYPKYRKYKQRRTKRQQHGGFLNWYDFSYAGRHTANRAMKGLDTLAPKLINQTSKEVDKIAEASKTSYKRRWATKSKNCITNYSRSY